MNALAEKIEGLLPFLEKQGLVYLFAFAERRKLDRWDVVLSAEWSDHETAIPVFTVSRELRLRLDPQEMTMLASIVIVPSNDRNFQELLLNMGDLSANGTKVVRESFLGSEVKQAFVFKIRHPPMVATGGDSALGMAVSAF